MSLDMHGHVDVMMESTPDGGVELITEGAGSYGPGGVWQQGQETTQDIQLVNIQQASKKTAEFFIENGDVMQPSDLRVLYINDGTTIRPDDDGKFAQVFRFSDGNQVRDWRVREADNRPWRNYTKVIVERFRGKQ